MRFVRLAALVGSLVLLVATAVLVVDNRGDLRAEQAARVEQSTTLSATSIRSRVTQVRQEVYLAAIATDRTGGGDDLLLAEQLVAFVTGAEACVGTTAAGCTGTDLFSLTLVRDLAGDSERGQPNADGAQAAVAVDPSTESIVAVSRVRGDTETSTVVLRLPFSELLTGDVQVALAETDTTVDLSATGAELDARTFPRTVDGERVVSETIATPFLDGSMLVTSRTDDAIGIVGDRFVRYGLQFLLGAVLLALAGWTFLVERRHLERRATTDELTSLINRREFERVSDIAIDKAESENSGLCVMVVDLNGFKQVNDTLGHQFGDLVLAASSERLVAAVRDTDIVGRWGGDEFVILLPSLAERSAVRTSAERIWHSLADHPVVGDTSMSASIGAAIYPRHGTTLDALMRAADVAMYEAKSTGVSHRIADTIATRESMLGDDTGQIPVVEVVTDEYAGPDRRHSPVPPPMQPPAELKRPIVPDAALPDAGLPDAGLPDAAPRHRASTDRTAADEPSVR
jgi:diguanylate cyclase (GGDEF)-like protein